MSHTAHPMRTTHPVPLFAPLATYRLRDTGSLVEALVVPERGGLVATFTVRGRDVLYLDDPTVRDGSASVRGGIPVLFPSPGKLTGDAWSRAGAEGRLPQHGFARKLAWTLPNLGESSKDAGADAG